MRILYIMPAFHPSIKFGGPVKNIFELCKLQVNAGHEVTVFTTDLYLDDSIPRNEEIDLDGLRVTYFKNNFLLKKINSRYFYSKKFNSQLKKTINDFDLVSIHDSRSIMNYIAAWVCTKNNIPYTIKTHGTLNYYNNKVLFKKVFDLLFTGFILKNAAKIFLLTEKEKEDFRKFNLPDEKFAILPNGIIISNYAKPPSKGTFRKKHGIRKQEKVILFLSRINERKGLHDLIEAFEKLNLSNTILVIAGDFEGCSKKYQKRIEDKIRKNDRIVYVGLLDEDGTKTAFWESDLFVLPARNEPFGIVYLEAMACGCPLLTYSNAGLAEEFRRFKSAHLIMEKDELTPAITQLLSDLNARVKLIEGGKVMVRDYLWEHVFEGYESLFQSLVIGKDD
ncbi:MAG: glycosyltransferase [Methanobacteriota archaeon]